METGSRRFHRRLAYDALVAHTVIRKEFGKSGKDKILPSVRPNVGLRAYYRKCLVGLVEEMHRSMLYWISAQWNKTPPRAAHDARPPADELQKVLKSVSKRWKQKFDEDAEKLAEYFGTKAGKLTDAQFKAMLKKSGFAVKFRMTKQQRDVMRAVVAENVSLIKSIPEQYLQKVEGSVMRSVAAGNDLASLSKDLQKNYGVSKRRAELISRDQNAKATAAFNRSRQIELGITEARWQHSSAGKTPRPSHVRNDGKRYDVKKGWYDPDAKQWIHPGELINCRCTSESIIPGFV